MNWCQYHPDAPQFLGPVTEGRMAGPAGRYQCCGQQAFRYETVPSPSGCQHREHTVLIETDRDRAILKMAQFAAEEGGCLYEAPPEPPKTVSSTAEPWWTGIMLAPNRDRQGLLPTLNVDTNTGHKKLNRLISMVTAGGDESSSETESSETNKCPLFKQFSTTSSDGCESDHSFRRETGTTRRRGTRRYMKIYD